MPSTSDVSGSGLPDESPLQESSVEGGGGVCPEQIIGRHLSVVGNRQEDIPQLLDLLHEVTLHTTIEEFPLSAMSGRANSARASSRSSHGKWEGR